MTMHFACQRLNADKSKQQKKMLSLAGRTVGNAIRADWHLYCSYRKSGSGL